MRWMSSHTVPRRPSTGRSSALGEGLALKG